MSKPAKMQKRKGAGRRDSALALSCSNMSTLSRPSSSKSTASKQTSSSASNSTLTSSNQHVCFSATSTKPSMHAAPLSSTKKVSNSVYVTTRGSIRVSRFSRSKKKPLRDLVWKTNMEETIAKQRREESKRVAEELDQKKKLLKKKAAAAPKKVESAKVSTPKQEKIVGKKNNERSGTGAEEAKVERKVRFGHVEVKVVERIGEEEEKENRPVAVEATLSGGIPETADESMGGVGGELGKAGGMGDSAADGSEVSTQQPPASASQVSDTVSNSKKRKSVLSGESLRSIKRKFCGFFGSGLQEETVEAPQPARMADTAAKNMAVGHGVPHAKAVSEPSVVAQPAASRLMCGEESDQTCSAEADASVDWQKRCDELVALVAERDAVILEERKTSDHLFRTNLKLAKKCRKLETTNIKMVTGRINAQIEENVRLDELEKTVAENFDGKLVDEQRKKIHMLEQEIGELLVDMQGHPIDIENERLKTRAEASRADEAERRLANLRKNAVVFARKAGRLVGRVARADELASCKKEQELQQQLMHFDTVIRPQMVDEISWLNSEIVSKDAQLRDCGNALTLAQAKIQQQDNEMAALEKHKQEWLSKPEQERFANLSCGNRACKIQRQTHSDATLLQKHEIAGLRSELQHAQEKLRQQQRILAAPDATSQFEMNEQHRMEQEQQAAAFDQELQSWLQTCQSRHCSSSMTLCSDCEIRAACQQPGDDRMTGITYREPYLLGKAQPVSACSPIVTVDAPHSSPTTAAESSVAVPASSTNSSPLPVLPYFQAHQGQDTSTDDPYMDL